MLKKITLTTILIVVLEVACVAAFMWATSPSVFYAGSHDGDCEKLKGETRCDCYQRLVAADSENFHK